MQKTKRPQKGDWPKLKAKYARHGCKPQIPESLNLYRFIRMVLGLNITDGEICRRWKMDPKNFHELSYGRLPVPRLSRLADLARVLKVNRHLVFEVALGTPYNQVYDLIKLNDVKGQVRLLLP